MAVKNIREEYLRCLQDKTRIYFIESYLSTFNADERKEVAFKLFPRQKVFLNSLVDNANTVAIKHRQCGVTTISSAWITGQLVFASKKAPETVLCIGNKLDISQQLVDKIGTFLDQVPRWMWGSEFYSPDPKSEKNTRSIYKKRNRQEIELFNGCKVYARSSGEHAARGISAVSILIFDEAAFIQNGVAVYAQAVAATASVANAKIIMVSTPNGKDPLYYKTYSQSLKKQNNYNPVEFKWYQDLRYNRNLKWFKQNEETGDTVFDVDPTTSPRGDIEYNEKRWRELEANGWTPVSPWYEDMCKSFNNDAQKIAQELNVSFLGSADNVVPVEIIEAQSQQNVIQLPEDWPLKDPFIRETWIWEDPIPEHRYILSVDSSSGAADDSTSIQILDIDAIDENGMPYVNQVLEYNGKLTGDIVGSIAAQYGHKYNDALIVVEDIGGYGSSAILTLMNMKYPNLYYDDPGLKTITIQRKYAEYNIKNLDDQLPGFHTSSMRTQMISFFVQMVSNNGFRIRSTRVISELETWIWKNGRPDHMDGAHDDNLTCLAMGLFVMQFSVLRLGDQKKRSASMLTSWRVNNGETIEKQPTPEAAQFATRYNNAFIATTNPYDERNKILVADTTAKKRFNGMLLLGGFGGFKK